MATLDITNVKNWLQKFGYLDESVSIPVAIANMQSLYGLNPTGEADSKTLKVMTIPRCGNRDVLPLREHLGGGGSTLYKWLLPQNRTLLYYLDRNSLDGLDLPFSDVQAIIRDAYNAWEASSNIKYMQIDNPNQAQIVMACGRGRPDGFDGPSNILAWAELPAQPGGQHLSQQLQLKFDADEPWYGKLRQRGIALLNTACHEIGHLNGLTHSNVSGALMAPTYSEAVPYPVKNDDIQRMVWRYGDPVVVVPPVVPPTIPPTVPPTIPPTIPVIPSIEGVRVKFTGLEGWHEYKTIST